MTDEQIIKDTAILTSEASETVMAIYCPRMGGEVDPTKLFAQKGKVALRYLIARQLLMHVLHDRYGWSHNKISKHVGMSRRNVHRAVSKMRDLTFTDILCREAMKIIDENLYRPVGQL